MSKGKSHESINFVNPLEETHRNFCAIVTYRAFVLRSLAKAVPSVAKYLRGNESHLFYVFLLNDRISATSSFSLYSQHLINIENSTKLP